MHGPAETDTTTSRLRAFADTRRRSGSSGEAGAIRGPVQAVSIERAGLLPSPSRPSRLQRSRSAEPPIPAMRAPTAGPRPHAPGPLDQRGERPPDDHDDETGLGGRRPANSGARQAPREHDPCPDVEGFLDAVDHGPTGGQTGPGPVADAVCAEGVGVGGVAVLWAARGGVVPRARAWGGPGGTQAS